MIGFTFRTGKGCFVIRYMVPSFHALWDKLIRGNTVSILIYNIILLLALNTFGILCFRVIFKYFATRLIIRVKFTLISFHIETIATFGASNFTAIYIIVISITEFYKSIFANAWISGTNSSIPISSQFALVAFKFKGVSYINLNFFSKYKKILFYYILPKDSN